MTEIYIHMGMFDFAVNVAIGTAENFVRYVRWKVDKPDFTMGERFIPRGVCVAYRGQCPIIWIPSFPRTPRQHATLSHEALHAAHHLLDWADIPRVEDTEEVLTHCMSYIVTSVLEARKR